MTCVTHCYAVLAIVSNSYPPLQGRLPTRYSPVRNSSARCKHQASAFYLHVLGTPPAFILSQDQTLIKIIVCLNSFCHWQIYCFFIVQYYNLSCSALHIGSSCSVFKGLCRSRATTILVYHVIYALSISFFYFFKHFAIFLILKKGNAVKSALP